MSSTIQFSLVSQPIDILSFAAAFHNPAAGAVLTFEGRVRNHNAGQVVTSLEYQAYPVLAMATGQRILEQEVTRYGILAAQAVHCTGPLSVGEVAVWVAVASAHRGPAFDAARAIMERLKYELPIWKKETYANGHSEWVGPDHKSAVTGRAEDELAEWQAELLEIWISEGNNFRGRHEKGRLDHLCRSASEIECVAGMGLKGDRYFGYKPDFKGQVTFMDTAAVVAVREHFSLPGLTSSVFRRNLVVRGVDLGAWVGKRFRFQDIDFEAVEECKPCYWMDQTVAPGVEEFLKKNFRGGLRARILSNGILKVLPKNIGTQISLPVESC